MSLLRFLLMSAVALPAFSAEPQEMVEVPCAEYKRLTGQDLCDVHPTLKWEKFSYEAAKRRLAFGQCRDEVLNKYAAYGVKRTDKGGWRQDPKPADVPEKDWVSCGPVRLTSGDESHACWEELGVCNERHSPPPKKKVDKPKEQIKLF